MTKLECSPDQPGRTSIRLKWRQMLSLPPSLRLSPQQDADHQRCAWWTVERVGCAVPLFDKADLDFPIG